MYTNATRLQETQETIDALLDLRKKMITAYCKLSGVSDFNNRDAETGLIDSEHLQTFCDIMANYVATGHFGVYQRIIEGKERGKAVKEATKVFYPTIGETTDYLVDFNDKYDTFDGSEKSVEILSKDAPRLGQIISTRSELEDKILAALQADTQE